MRCARRGGRRLTSSDAAPQAAGGAEGAEAPKEADGDKATEPPVPADGDDGAPRVRAPAADTPLTLSLIHI